MYKCKYCDKNFENPKSVGGHTISCKNNPNRKTPFQNVTKEQRISINLKINSNTHTIEKRKKTFEINHKSGKHKPFKGIGGNRINEDNRRKKLSEFAKSRNLGGYVKGSGRGKKGWYKGFWCDSSYELAWIIFNIDHNIKFDRNTKKFVYLFNGKELKWIPDFILDDGSYVEIKGFLSEQNIAKIKSFSGSLTVLTKEGLYEVFKYVQSKYGKDYIKLYDGGLSEMDDTASLEN